MRKYKCNPPKPGWYMAWFCGTELNFSNLSIEDFRNHRYWDGENWYLDDTLTHPTTFMDLSYSNKDRWSYISKEKSKC